MRHLLLFLSACSFTVVCRATHIIGGELYYDHLEGDQYLVTLKMYRDCGPGNTNNQGFDASAELGVFSGSGAYLFSAHAAFPGATSVPVTLDDPCLSAPPSVCVEVALYTFLIDLPPSADGYQLTYQRCCRSPTVVNIPTPGDYGLTCTVQVPGQAVTLLNSAPRFNALPPIALCLDQDMTFDHSATDPDGDQLVYTLSTPFNGGDNFNTTPSPPTAPPYAMVPWGSGYSEIYPMASTPPAAVHPVTGMLTAHPSMIGSYTVCVSVKEYRGGVLLSEVRRDLRFDVVACNASVTAVVPPQQAFCSGLTVDFGNNSIGGQVWHWDFGVPTSLADTSVQEEPTWTYAEPGTYTVTLIANPGLTCADTADAVYQVYEAAQPFFEPPAPFCGPQELTLTAGGAFDPTATLDWDLGPGASPSTATGPSVTAQFAPIGPQTVTLTVTQNGCTSSYAAAVVGHPLPTVSLAVDPPSPQLAGTPVSLHGGSLSTGITGYTWYVDGEPMPWTGADPVWTDTRPGIHTLTVEVTTADGCTASFDVIYVITAGEIVIPNVFSPNGDGHNDRFTIPNVQFLTNTLKVYNRWGQVVFEAANYKNQWAATDVPEGTYYYVLHVEGEEHAGHVTILR